MLTVIQRKFNVSVTIALIRGGLVDPWQHDERLSKFIYKDPRPNLLNFAAGFIRESLTSDPPVITRQQCALSVGALAHSVQLGHATDEYVQLIIQSLTDLMSVCRPCHTDLYACWRIFKDFVAYYPDQMSRIPQVHRRNPMKYILNY